MKKVLAFLTVFAILFFPLSSIPVTSVSSTSEQQVSSTPEQQVSGGFEPPFSVNAESVILINLDSGDVVYEKNADDPRPPASLTKVMTALLLVESVPDLAAVTVTAPSYIYNEFYGLTVSTADIRAGEELNLEQVLYGMMLQSANEGASIVADYLSGGDIPAFAAEMTQRAKELGCENTNFTNPHGLHSEEQYSTARDMATITLEALKHQNLVDAAYSSRYTIPANNKHTQSRILVTTCAMQDENTAYYKNYVHGFKTGTLPEAGHNYISTATQNGENYLLVVMGADSDGVNAAGEPLSSKPAFDITADIYNWVYNNFTVRPVIEAGAPVEQVPLKYSEESDTLLLYPSESIYSLLSNDEDERSLTRIYELPEFAEAPIEEGTVVGTLTVKRGEMVLGSADLMAAQSFERSDVLYYTAQVMDFFNSSTFKVVVGIIAVAVLLYATMLLLSIRRYNLQRRRGKKQPPKHINRRMR